MLSSCLLYARQDAVLLDQKTNIVLNGRSLLKEISYKIRINNRSGDEYASVSIVKSGLSQISGIEAKVTDINGITIRKLKSSEIKKSHLITNAAFFQDNLLYEFELSHYSYPYILEYSYTERENQFLDIEYWRPLLNCDVLTEKATLKLLIPINYPYKTIISNIDKPRIDTVDNKLQLTWNACFKPLPEPEKLMPPLSSFYPFLRIIPEHFYFGTSGTFVDWKSYGQWQYETNKKLQFLTEGAVAEIKVMTDSCKSDREKVKLLYQKLQDETRYVNISTETGGLIPMSATEVHEKKYGDCKALSNYFCAVLAVAGVPAIYTDIFAGSVKVPFFPDIPSQQFNHVIVCVPGEKDSLWIDCTSDGPMGSINAFIQGRNVLLIEDQKSRLSKVPALQAEENLQERHIITEKDTTGRSIAVFHNLYRSSESLILKELATLPQETERRKYIIDRFAANQAELIDYRINSGNRNEDTTSLTLRMKLNAKHEKAGNDDLIYFFPFDIPLLQKPGLRKYPIQIDVPVYLKDIQIVKNKLPITGQWQDVSIKTVYGNYSRKAIITADGIKLTKTLLLNPGNYSLAAYPDFYSFMSQVREAEQFTILIQKDK